VEQNRVLSLEGGYVEIADSGKLNDIGSQVTIEAWVKVAEFTDQHMPIVYKGDSRVSDLSNVSFACLVRRDGAICLNAPPRGQSVHTFHSPPSLIEPNTWFHIAGVVDGRNGTMSLFFNGAEVARTSFNGNLLNQSALPLRIGWMYEDEEARIWDTAGTQTEIQAFWRHEDKTLSCSPFAGQMDEMRIWNTAGTQAEIQAAMHTSLTGKEPGLVGYWHVGSPTTRKGEAEDVGSPTTRKESGKGVVIDSSPECSHGRLVGDAYFIEAELPEQGEIAIPAVLSGKIMDETGQPRRAWYKLKCDEEEIESRRTNISGEYRIVIPHPGEGSYDLYASSGKLGDMRLDIPLHRGIGLDVDLTLWETVRIQGKLLMLDDETPHMDVAIQAIQDGKVVDAAFSDDKGEYWFVNLKPGEYQVRCHVLGGYIYYGEDQSMSGKPVSLHVELGKTISDVDFRFMPFKRGTWRTYDSSDGLTSMYVHDVHQDREGMLWFASGSYSWYGGSGVSRYDGKDFVTFTTEDGLVSNSVWTIHSAADGTLWFGTREGISRYDGKRFTNFTTEDGLVHNHVTDIDSAPDGAIWFGTWGGVSRYDPGGMGDSPHFTNFTAKDGLLSNYVDTIYCDPDGTVWIGTRNGGGVSRYDGVGFTNFTWEDGLLSDSVLSIHRDSAGMMWFGTGNPYRQGVFRYDGVEFVNFSVRDGLPGTQVRAINSTPDGALWFGTDRGVSRYDGKSFVNFSGQGEEIPSSPVDGILVSGDGSLWFATDLAGVARYDERSFSSLTVSHGLPAGWIQGIYRDPDDTLWVGATDGLARYSGSRHNPVLTTYTMEDGVVPRAASVIHPSPDGTLWFGTCGANVSVGGQGIFYYDPEDDSSAPFVNLTISDGLAHRHVNNIVSEPDGTIWIATTGGVSRYDGEKFVNFTKADGLADNMVFRVHRSADGILWFGTLNGLSRYDGKGFTNFTTEDGLGRNTILSIDSDAYGNLWIAEYGAGLSRYDGSEFINYTHKDGLANNWVQYVYHDAEGLTWFATYGGGVSGYDGTAWTILDTWDGLSYYNNVFSVNPDSDGSLWFGTQKGATNYRRNKTKPGVRIVSVTTDKTYSDLSSVPAFIVGTRVTIQYNAIDFKTHPDRRQYRCQVFGEGLSEKEMDLSWQSPTRETSFDWIPDEEGTYTFAVQAIDRDLNYSKPATLSLTVQPDPKLVSMQMELEDLRQEVSRKYHFSSFMGESAAVQQVHALMERAIDSGLTVLITGETGTGKELVARAIHHNSPRKNEPILDRNCGAIPRELLTSELFGHRKGAFTGANEDKMGLFEAASGGTVQLDEIGEMPQDAQVHLLRFLEEREIQRLGENISRHVDVRIIATTNRDLAEEVTADRFREDLYYRLSEFPIHIPPLRERPEDVPLLAEHFLKDMDKELDGFAPGVIEMLQSYSWPGNVRELRNVIRRASALAEEGKQIQTYHFPPSITQGESLVQEIISEQNNLSASVEGLKRRMVENALRKCDGNRTHASEMLGMNRPNLIKLIKRLDIDL